MKKFALFIFLVLAPVANPTVAAARANFLIDRWTTENGLPQNSVTSLVQTRDGYLWAGTFGGLARFDGVKFTVFNTVNAPEIKNQRITALYEDSAGRLWIGTETGEISFYRDGRFFAFDSADGKVGVLIQAFCADAAGFLWAGDTRGVRRYQLSENGYAAKERVELPPNIAGVSEQIVAIAEDRTGAIWLGTHYDDFPGRVLRWRAQPQASAFQAFTTADGLPAKLENGIESRHIFDLAIDSRGDLRVMTIGGAARFDGKRFVVDLRGAAATDGWYKFARDSDGGLWVNRSDGAAQSASGGGEWIKYGAAAMPKNGARAFVVDSENNLWLGTNGEGLWRLKPSAVQSFTEKDGVARGEAATVFEDRAGNLWIGGYGLRRLENNRFVAVPVLADVFVLGLGETRDGALWIGSFNTVYSLRGGELIDHRAELAAAVKKAKFTVKAIYEDSGGALWFGLGDEGLLRRDANGNYERFTTENGLIYNTVSFVHETADGALWFGTLGGASRFADGRFQNFTVADGLQSNIVRAIHEDRDGAIWLGTYGGGLSRLKNGQIKTVTMRDGLFDDVVSRILIDENDNFWMLGNRGVFVASRGELNLVADAEISQIACRSFGKADGMITNEGNGGNQPAGWLARDGKFWFPTIAGFVAISPSAPARFLPPAIIEEVLLDNKSLALPDRIVIQPGQQNLEIRYTGLGFSKPEALRFRYRLDNLETDWTEAGTRRAAFYSYLPPGEYVFTVVAANPDGVWNQSGKSIKITVIAPFYRTWWFAALAFFLISAAVFTIYRARVSALEREKRKQQEFSRRLIELQEAERKRIAAELHDSLSQNLVIIKNRALISLSQRGETGQAFEQMEEIAEAAAQSLSEVREIAHNLRPFQIDRLGITEAIAAIAERAETGDLRILIEIESIDDLLSQEKEINLYRIVQESLNNIIKHSAATRATVKIAQNDGIIELTIEDDGKGFDPAALESSSRRNAGGFGLIGISERARTLGTTPVIESAPGKGTKIYLRINVEPMDKTSSL